MQRIWSTSVRLNLCSLTEIELSDFCGFKIVRKSYSDIRAGTPYPVLVHFEVSLGGDEAQGVIRTGSGSGSCLGSPSDFIVTLDVNCIIAEKEEGVSYTGKEIDKPGYTFHRHQEIAFCSGL